MSLVRVDTIKPITSGADLSLQGDSGGSAVDCLNITSAGDVDFSGNTDAKIKLPSGGGIYESDGTTPVLTESGGVVSLGAAVSVGSVGKILQVVSVNQPAVVSVASSTVTGTDWGDISGLSVAITPAATSSKVLVLVSVVVSTSSVTYAMLVRLMRASTVINGGTSAGSRFPSFGHSYVQNTTAVEEISMNFLDSPSSTSATTYKVQWQGETGTNFFLNSSGSDADNQNTGRFASNITLLEIAA
jgi:hypothetical protein